MSPASNKSTPRMYILHVHMLHACRQRRAATPAARRFACGALASPGSAPLRRVETQPHGRRRQLHHRDRLRGLQRRRGVAPHLRIARPANC